MQKSIVTVATFCTSDEAHFARTILSLAGIDAFLADDYLVAIYFLYGPAVGGVKVQVRSDKAEQAISILKETVQSKIAPAKVVETKEDMAQRAYRLSVIGLYFLPLQLYSLWIMCRLRFHLKNLRPGTRRRLIMAGVANQLVVVFIVLIIIGVCVSSF